jgi:hypothetical protein
MDLVPIKIKHGEEEAWGLVCGLSRDDIERRWTCAFRLVLSDVVWAVALMTCVVMIDG